MFASRYLKHVKSGLLCENQVVSTVFRSALVNVSRMGNNIRHFCFMYGIDPYSLFDMSIPALSSRINQGVSQDVTDEDIRISVQIKELCLERDSYNMWVLERSDINDIINFLCTM